MRKNEQWIGTCSGYTFDGAGVVKQDGYVYFVKGLMNGETAKLAVTKQNKNYGFSRIVEILEPSSHRVTPKCSVSKACGGCQIGHMDEVEQRAFKEQVVHDAFLKNTHMELEIPTILSGEKVDHYRNKVQVPVKIKNNKVEMGFYRPRSNDIVSFDECLVQTDTSNQIVKSLKDWMEELKCDDIFRHILIKHAQFTNEVMVCFIVRKAPFAQCETLCNRLVQTYPNIKSIMLMVNTRNDNVILSGKETCLYGRDYIEEELLGCKFKISMRSFYQINPYATKVLYAKALEFANIQKDETVIDLYCGTGTIGLLASKYAKNVYGIEIVEEAIKDAFENAKNNHINNVDFFAMDAGEGANYLIEQNVQPNIVIVDPPRKGCSKETMDAIFKMDPSRVVYVSCDPATLARDCAYFKEHKYDIQKVQPVDMFPNTVHVETIVLLVKKEHQI